MKLRDYQRAALLGLEGVCGEPTLEPAIRFMELHKSAATGKSVAPSATIVMATPTARRLLGGPELQNVEPPEFVKMSYADFEAAVMARFAENVGVDLAQLVVSIQRMGRALRPDMPEVPRWDEVKPGTLKVAKNERTKGSHPQPHYYKGRW
ncbi:hypothetical protein [Vibrio phage VP16C]|nr:hypothetical protein [Vibrio phage VP16C]